MVYWYEFLILLKIIHLTPTKVNEWLNAGNYSHLKTALKRSNQYKIRAQILDGLLQKGYKDQEMMNILIPMINDDFIFIAEKALFLLEKIKPGLDSKAKKICADAVEKLESRKKREKNLNLYHQKYIQRHNSTKLIDKSKMARLEKVRGQLKNPIWFTP